MQIHLYQFLESTCKQYHVDKEDAVCLYNGILLSHKNNELKPTVATWMNLEITIRSEISQIKTKAYKITVDF